MSQPFNQELGKLTDNYAENEWAMALGEAQPRLLEGAIGRASLNSDKVIRTIRTDLQPDGTVSVSAHPPFANPEQARNAVTHFTRGWAMVVRFLTPEQRAELPQFIPNPDFVVPSE